MDKVGSSATLGMSAGVTLGGGRHPVADHRCSPPISDARKSWWVMPQQHAISQEREVASTAPIRR